MYLVDTNVISEARKGKRCNRGVQKFWQNVAENEVFVSVQTIGEIRRGVENIRHRGDSPQASQLGTWLEALVEQYADRILAFDVDCTQVWGKLMSPHPQHPVDKQIAAIALIYDLTVVTRNTDDFQATGIRLLNPFV
jgi:predicted nucleic acid-binding protein